MEIQKLKKKLLREELRRRRKNSKTRRLAIRFILLLLVLALGGLIYYAGNLERMLEEDYVRGETLVEQGNYERAAKIFHNLYNRHSSFHLAPQALFQCGEIYNLFLHKYQEALLAYLLVEKNYPNTDLSRKAQQQVAEIYKYRLMDYPRAIVAYQKLLDGGILEGDRIQNEVADSYFRLNNFEQARIEFESLVKNYPDSRLIPEAVYRIAMTHTLEGAPREAEGAFRRVIEKWPDNPFAVEARFGLATVLEDQDELVESLRILEKLKGIYPNAEALAKKTDQVRERIRKKKKAI